MVSHGTGSSSSYDNQTRDMHGQTGERAEQVKEAAGQAREQAGQMTDQVKEQASKVTDKAKEQASTRVDDQKERAVHGIHGFADALNQVSGSMREQNPSVANFTETAASKLDEFAGALHDKDVNELIGDIERMARKQPALFIGGAFVAGVVAARFLKSSSGMTSGSTSHDGYDRYDRRYNSAYDTRGYSSQYSSQYGRPTSSTTYGSTPGTTGRSASSQTYAPYASDQTTGRSATPGTMADRDTSANDLTSGQQ